jgi:hypothetical protein
MRPFMLLLICLTLTLPHRLPEPLWIAPHPRHPHRVTPEVPGTFRVDTDRSRMDNVT